MSDDHENSKEAADAGSFGMKIDFHTHEELSTDRFTALIEKLLVEVGKRVVEHRGSMVGHIKAFVTTEDGTLKVNLIDMELGTDILNRIQSPVVHRGEIKFMAALVGVDDHEIEEIMEESLEVLEGPLELEIEEHEHEHEHEH